MRKTMCGIVGYLGKEAQARDVLIDGLKRLEYRGYDSAGVAVMTQRGISCVKAVGKVAVLEEKLGAQHADATVGIAHTRWATHGKPSVENAHPHTAGRITLVHNGIIENYKELRILLQEKGRTFRSETDSEVLAHLIDDVLSDACDFACAVRTALRSVRGTYALVVMSETEPDTLIAAKSASPLVLGICADAIIFASDASAIIAHTQRVVYPHDGDVVVARRSGDAVTYALTSLGGEERQSTVETLGWNQADAQKEGYAHFMLKEIFEQPLTTTDAMRGRIDMEKGMARLGGLQDVAERLRHAQRVIIVSCGTSYHAGLIGKYMLEEYASVTTSVEHASEFRYRNPRLDESTVVIALSQSGETADTIAALEEAKNKGALTLGIVNSVGSTIARMTDAGVYNHAGPEIGVASTKTFTSQLVILVLMTVFLGRQRAMSLVMGQRILRALRDIPQKIEAICTQSSAIEDIARRYYASCESMLVIGRMYNFPIALEGALKVKEISYVHAEGYPSGEMKHGPIALIDEYFPTIVIAPMDSIYEKNLSGVAEIKARGGSVLAITTDGAEAVATEADAVLEVPETLDLLMPILTVVPLQFIAYFIGVQRGYDVDKPRNLAKSVTVE